MLYTLLHYFHSLQTNLHSWFLLHQWAAIYRYWDRHMCRGRALGLGLRPLYGLLSCLSRQTPAICLHPSIVLLYMCTDLPVLLPPLCGTALLILLRGAGGGVEECEGRWLPTHVIWAVSVWCDYGVGWEEAGKEGVTGKRRGPRTRRSRRKNKQQHDLSVHVTWWCALVSGSASAGFFTGSGHMLGSGYGNTDYLENFNYIF